MPRQKERPSGRSFFMSVTATSPTNSSYRLMFSTLLPRVLNDRKIATPMGKPWSAMTVIRARDRILGPILPERGRGHQPR